MFGKLDRTIEQNLDGIGMGLTICKKIVENNDGYIDVFSAGEDQGSTFIFSMKMSQIVEDSLNSSDTVNETTFNQSDLKEKQELLEISKACDSLREEDLRPYTERIGSYSVRSLRAPGSPTISDASRINLIADDEMSDLSVDFNELL